MVLDIMGFPMRLGNLSTLTKVALTGPLFFCFVSFGQVKAEEQLPWKTDESSQERPMTISPGAKENPLPPDETSRRGYRTPRNTYDDRNTYNDDAYSAPRDERNEYRPPRYSTAPRYDRRQDSDREPNYDRQPDYNQRPPADTYGQEREPHQYGERYPYPAPGEPAPREPETFTNNEILRTGHRFFGSVSGGLARVIEYAFSRNGRPNGYILGEEAGGAFIAGLRYGEGTLYTKDAGRHKIYWQGPSLGYDFGAEGSKTMILVYNLRYPEQIFERFSGIDGSAYLVGGVGITFQQHNGVTLAPIRSGVGVRLGANVGYLKYTPRPTWNPF